MTQEALTKLLHAVQQLAPEEQMVLITQLTLVRRERLRCRSLEGEEVLKGWQ